LTCDYILRTYPEFFPSQTRLQLFTYIDYSIASSFTAPIYYQLLGLHGGIVLRRECAQLMNYGAINDYLLYRGMCDIHSRAIFDSLAYHH